MKGKVTLDSSAVLAWLKGEPQEWLGEASWLREIPS